MRKAPIQWVIMFLIIAVVSFILGALLGGCGGHDIGRVDDKVQGFGLRVAEVNGCQYVIFVSSSSGGTAMVHAGNCNNPIHKKQ